MDRWTDCNLLLQGGRAPTIGRGGTDLNMARKPGIASHFFSRSAAWGDSGRQRKTCRSSDEKLVKVGESWRPTCQWIPVEWMLKCHPSEKAAIRCHLRHPMALARRCPGPSGFLRKQIWDQLRSTRRWRPGAVEPQKVRREVWSVNIDWSLSFIEYIAHIYYVYVLLLWYTSICIL